MAKDQRKKASEKPPTTMQEAGRKGGLRVSEKYGHAFFADIGKKGGRALAEKRDSAYFAEIGRRGGESTLRRHGIKYFSKIGARSAMTLHPPDVVEDDMQSR